MSDSITLSLKCLEELYTKTGRDWYLTVRVSLTEPECPLAIIQPEGGNHLRYAVHRDKIEQAIIDCAELVFQEQILGNKMIIESPVTNPDDHTDPLFPPTKKSE